MRRAALLVSLVPAVALTGPAVAQEHPAGAHGPSGGGVGAAAGSVATNEARIGFAAMVPSHLDVVAGETIRWTNDSARVHTVTADDGSFDSGRMSAAATFAHRFAAPGATAYHCTLHPLIRGDVAVHDILLEPPAQAAAPGRPFPLDGRAALAAGTPVTIERDEGTGFAPIASAQVGADGRFAARIVPASSADYRAVAAAATSPARHLPVLDRRISLHVRHRGARTHLRATVTPHSRGGRIVLQLYLPERFGWWPVHRATLGKHSQAHFTLSSRRRLRARVRYTLADGVTTLATSRTARIRPHPSHNHERSEEMQAPARGQRVAG